MQKYNCLENLSDPQRRYLLDLLEEMTYDQARERLALPPPDGLDLRTSRSSLSRFSRKAHLQEFLDHKEDDLAQAHAITAALVDPQVVEDAALALLRQQLLTAALQPAKSTEELVRLFSILFKLKRLKCEERKLQLAELNKAETTPQSEPDNSYFMECLRKCYDQPDPVESPVQV